MISSLTVDKKHCVVCDICVVLNVITCHGAEACRCVCVREVLKARCDLTYDTYVVSSNNIRTVSVGIDLKELGEGGSAAEMFEVLHRD